LAQKLLLLDCRKGDAYDGKKRRGEEGKSEGWENKHHGALGFRRSFLLGNGSFTTDSKAK